MIRPGLLALLASGVLLVCNAAAAQELALDLHVRPGSFPESVIVELFPSNPQSSSFRLFLKSDEGEETVAATALITTLSNLKSGKAYTISAAGISSDGEVTETSPDESIVVP